MHGQRKETRKRAQLEAEEEKRANLKTETWKKEIEICKKIIKNKKNYNEKKITKIKKPKSANKRAQKSGR